MPNNNARLIFKLFIFQTFQILLLLFDYSIQCNMFWKDGIWDVSKWNPISLQMIETDYSIFELRQKIVIRILKNIQSIKNTNKFILLN